MEVVVVAVEGVEDIVGGDVGVGVGLLVDVELGEVDEEVVEAGVEGDLVLLGEVLEFENGCLELRIHVN